jgi:hypothetical protein
MFSQFYFRPAKGEWIQTVVTPEDEASGGIYGRVEAKGAGIKDALVLLFISEGERAGAFLSAVTTGEGGEFAFGPLVPGQLYMVKVFKDGLKLRELEISV